MRDTFEDWFAQSEHVQTANTDTKEALFVAFEAGAKAQSDASVPADKLRDEITHLKDRIDQLNNQLSKANNRVQELEEQPVATPGHPDNPIGQSDD